jgi:hypothetical protein
MTVDTGFIGRTLKTTGILGLLILIFGSYYYGFRPAISVFTGIIWGMVNLYFLSLLVRSTLRLDGADKATALVVLFIKFPLLYVSGYFLMVSDYFSQLLLLAGFTLNLLVIVLKAAGRTLMKLDYIDSNEKQESLKSV